MQNKVNVSWDDVENFVEKFQSYLHEKQIKPSGVYGIPRGGVILATLLSYRLDIPLLAAPCNHCIVVDDIADSGRTLLHYTDNDTQFNKYLIATMYYHQRSLVKPDFYLFEKTDEWINFPWEK